MEINIEARFLFLQQNKKILDGFFSLTTETISFIFLKIYTISMGDDGCDEFLCCLCAPLAAIFCCM